MLFGFLRSLIQGASSVSHSSSGPLPIAAATQVSDATTYAQDLPTVTRIGVHSFLVKARHGIFLAHSNDFYIGSAIIKYGEFSELEANLFERIVRPGDAVAEVGANIGAHTIALARLVGSTGHVIAVEAQPFIYRQLCANLALNGLDNVTAVECGCGARPDVMYLPKIDYDTPGFANFGGVSLMAQSDTPKVEATAVAVRTLDSIVGERVIDFLKIDVEGMELDVLQGALTLIARSRPVMYVENDRIERSADLIRLLLSLGYRLFWHAPQLYNEGNFFCESVNVFGAIASWNMLCVPREKDLQIAETNGAELKDPDFHPLRHNDPFAAIGLQRVSIE